MPQDPRTRIIEAAYTCVARYGLEKTTVEDAAREAGLSRATLYRYFPGGRDELLRTVITWETMRFFSRLYEVLAGMEELEEIVGTGLAYAHRALRAHDVLQKILQTEPELLLPQLTIEGGRVIEMIAAFLRPYVERHLAAATAFRGPDRDPGRAERIPADSAEASAFLARMILSFIVSPGRWDLEDPHQVRRLVRTELLAGMTVAPGPGPGPGRTSPPPRSRRVDNETR